MGYRSGETPEGWFKSKDLRVPVIGTLVVLAVPILVIILDLFIPPEPGAIVGRTGGIVGLALAFFLTLVVAWWPLSYLKRRIKVSYVRGFRNIDVRKIGQELERRLPLSVQPVKRSYTGIDVETLDDIDKIHLRRVDGVSISMENRYFTKKKFAEIEVRSSARKSRTLRDVIAAVTRIADSLILEEPSFENIEDEWRVERELAKKEGTRRWDRSMPIKEYNQFMLLILAFIAGSWAIILPTIWYGAEGEWIVLLFICVGTGQVFTLILVAAYSEFTQAHQDGIRFKYAKTYPTNLNHTISSIHGYLKDRRIKHSQGVQPIFSLNREVIRISPLNELDGILFIDVEWDKIDEILPKTRVAIVTTEYVKSIKSWTRFVDEAIFKGPGED